MQVLPKVSVIIVTYNSKDAVKCIKSVKENDFPSGKFEIIVVDNNSSDNSLAQIKKTHPDVAIVKLDENYGFGIGCNHGAETAHGKYLVFLNPDSEVDKKWLSNLVNEIENNKNAGTVTSKIAYYRHRNEIDSLGCFLSIYGIFGSIKSFQYFKPHTFDVFAPSGASFIIAKRTFEKIGGFDRNLFLYAVDIGWRISNLGLRNILSPESIMYHKTELSTLHKKPYFYFYNSRNFLLTIIKNGTFPYIIPMLTFSTFIHFSRFITFLLAGRIDHAKATFGGMLWVLTNLRQVIKIRNSATNRNNRYIKFVTGFKKSIPIILSKTYEHLS